MNGITIISKDVDLVFSPDDSGFYFQKYLHNDDGDTQTSQIFFTQVDALEAYKTTQIVWEG